MLICIILGGVGFVYFDKQTASWHLTPVTLPESASSNTDTFAPLPFVVLKDHPKVALGKRLFNEPKLSGNASVSCAHCHNLATGGIDRAVRSRGIDGKEGSINAPTVFNSSLNFRQFFLVHGRVIAAQIAVKARIGGDQRTLKSGDSVLDVARRDAIVVHRRKLGFVLRIAG